MGKVYAPPAEIQPPEYDYSKGFDFEEHERRDNEYVQRVIDYCIAEGSGDSKGKEINFGVGDGYARYIVFSTKPVVLIHLAVGDGWQYQYAHRLTAKDIAEEIRHKEAWAKIPAMQLQHD
jgi:hypothetical protein